METERGPLIPEGGRVTKQFEAYCGKCGWKRTTFSEFEGRVRLAEHHCGMIDSEVFVSLNQMTLPGDWEG